MTPKSKSGTPKSDKPAGKLPIGVQASKLPGTPAEQSDEEEEDDDDEESMEDDEDEEMEDEDDSDDACTKCFYNTYLNNCHIEQHTRLAIGL